MLVFCYWVVEVLRLVWFGVCVYCIVIVLFCFFYLFVVGGLFYIYVVEKLKVEVGNNI